MTSRAPLIAFGGSVGFTAVMATIGMGLGRQWVQIDPLVWADTWLATFLFLLPCIAVTLTPAAIAVVVALRNAPVTSRERRVWQIAAAGLAVSVLITLVYHLPTNIRIWTPTKPPLNSIAGSCSMPCARSPVWSPSSRRSGRSLPDATTGAASQHQRSTDEVAR